jgi:hypothetical protein
MVNSKRRRKNTQIQRKKAAMGNSKRRSKKTKSGHCLLNTWVNRY